MLGKLAELALVRFSFMRGITIVRQGLVFTPGNLCRSTQVSPTAPSQFVISRPV